MMKVDTMSEQDSMLNYLRFVVYTLELFISFEENKQEKKIGYTKTPKLRVGAKMMNERKIYMIRNLMISSRKKVKKRATGADVPRKTFVLLKIDDD